MEESVSDYFDLITKSERYRKALVTNSPLECITAIKNGGYATSPTYVKTIMAIINGSNLTKYDKIEENEINYKIGNVYTLQVNLNVRTGAGTDFERKKYKDLTEDGKKHALYTKTNDYAVLKKGTRVTCIDIIFEEDSIWMRIPSGYVCAIFFGKEYIK